MVVGMLTLRNLSMIQVMALSEEEAHHIHHWHHIGAILSIIIAFGGVFLARSMYITKKNNPGWWVNTFAKWYRALQNKYYFDSLYIKGVIQKMLLPLNNLLARFDLGVYDRYAVDGWESINRFLYRVSAWIDNNLVDQVMVDGTGFGVRAFNTVLRVVQTGKVQFYFLVLFVVLIGYIFSLNIFI